VLSLTVTIISFDFATSEQNQFLHYAESLSNLNAAIWSSPHESPFKLCERAYGQFKSNLCSKGTETWKLKQSSTSRCDQLKPLTQPFWISLSPICLDHKTGFVSVTDTFLWPCWNPAIIIYHHSIYETHRNAISKLLRKKYEDHLSMALHEQRHSLLLQLHKDIIFQ